MNEFFLRRLRPLVKYIVRYPVIIMTFSLLLAAVGLWLALNLRIDNDYSKLIPGNYPSVQALEKLRQQVGSSSELAVVIESPSFEVNKEFAETLIPKAMELRNPADGTLYFTRYDYKKETDFLQSNALYFATGDELDLLETFLDQEIENARLSANPFYFEFDEDTAESDSLTRELEDAYSELIGTEYPVSADSLVMAVRFHPSGSQTDIQYIREIYEEMNRLTDQILADFTDADIQVFLAGRLLRSLIEIESIYQDVSQSFAAGVLMLLALVTLYFFYKNYRIRSGGRFSLPVFIYELKHIPITALIMCLPLGVSLCWTFGVTWLAFQSLNIMTSTLGLLLFGMGIDFGIHFYARYIEERGEGSPVTDAIETTFLTTGQAITAVGITTSAAFFILMLADFKGFSEFGFIAGIGILFAIITMIVVLPALIIVLERRGWLTAEPTISLNKRPVIKKFYSSSKLVPIALIVVGISLTATVLSGWQARNLSFEYEFGKLEPEYEAYNEVAREARKVYSDRRTRNAAYIIADTPEDAVEIRNLLNNRITADTLSGTIRSVETLQDRYPFTPTEQQARLRRIDTIRTKLDDPFLKQSDSDQLERIRKASATERPVPLQEIPGFILEPFTSRDGTVGNLVIIYPSVPLSDGRNSMNFADDLSDITLENGKVYHAGSTSIVASDMLRLMIRETPWMIAATLTFILLIKLFIFGKIKWMVLALLPLVTSFIWLFGLTVLAGWKLNFYNIVVLPTILGIGDDSGIHLVHRYLEEGRGKIMKVMRSTGEHITVSALTTMLGFAGLLFSGHPGMRSIGELAVLGIGLMLLASLILLPAIFYLLEKNYLNTVKQVTDYFTRRSEQKSV